MPHLRLQSVNTHRIIVGKTVDLRLRQRLCLCMNTSIRTVTCHLQSGVCWHRVMTENIWMTSANVHTQRHKQRMNTYLWNHNRRFL